MGNQGGLGERSGEAQGQDARKNTFPISACGSPREDSLEILLEKNVRVTDFAKQYKDHPNSPIFSTFSIFYFRAFNPDTHFHLIPVLIPVLIICYVLSASCSFSSYTRSGLGPGIVLSNVSLLLFKLENLLSLSLLLMALKILKSRVTPRSIFMVYWVYFLPFPHE